MSFVASKINDYFSIFQERAVLYKTLKDPPSNKGSIKKYIDTRNKSPIKDPKIGIKQKIIERNNEIQRENGILSQKLVNIITRNKHKSQDFQTNNQKIQPTSQKSQAIQMENIRMFNLLSNIKPLIATKDLKESWKNTKKYRRNLRSFNKFNQPKPEMHFLNKNCNKNIAIYLKECYLPDKNNILNVTAPNYKPKITEKRGFQIEGKRWDRSFQGNKAFSCETCHKKQEENIKNCIIQPYKLLLDSSMAC